MLKPRKTQFLLDSFEGILQAIKYFMIAVKIVFIGCYMTVKPFDLQICRDIIVKKLKVLLRKT